MTGERSYDDLDDEQQTRVREERWDKNIDARIAGLDFTAALRAAGHPYVTADDDGITVEHALIDGQWVHERQG